MNVTVTKDQIIEGLQKASSILPQKAGTVYMRCIWLKADDSTLSVMATDASIEFTGTYPAEISEKGFIGVPGRAFVDLIRQLPAGKLTLSLDKGGSTLLVKQGRRSYKLPVSGEEWFQSFSPLPDNEPIIWSGDVLLDIIEKVSFCIDDDDAREAMACLCLKATENGRIDACGLNGHQFALYQFVNDEIFNALKDKPLLIQKKYLQDIKKWLGPNEIELSLSDKKLHLKGREGSEILSVPRMMHEYPDYNVFMSKLSSDSLSTLYLPRQETSDALGRVLIFNTENDRCVFMDMSETELGLFAEGAEVGSAREEIEATYKGNIERIAFPTKNLMDIFGHFSSMELEMKFTGPEGPCGIKGGNDTGYSVIIMPMKVAEKVYYTEEDL